MPKKTSVEPIKSLRAAKKKHCRICLKKNPSLVSLFNSFKNHTFAYYINSIADVKISENDEKPNKICNECVQKIEDLIGFKEKCEDSSKYLDSLLAKANEKAAVKTEHKQGKFEFKKEKTDPIEFVDGCKANLKVDNQIKDEVPEMRLEYLDDFNLSHSGSEKDCKPGSPVPKKQFDITGLDCLECGKTFKNETKRKMHWYNVHKKKSYKCFSCQRVFKSLSVYEKHTNKKISCESRFKGVRIEGSGKSRIFHCTSCDYKSNALDCVRKHLVRHSGERPHACNLCSKAYTSHKSLSYHKETVHKLYKIEITCHMCGKVVEGRHRFNRHFRFSHPNNQFQCDICKAFVKSKWGLIYHIKTHDNLKEYVCETCGRTFNTPFSLRNHIRVVHEEKTFDCKMCEYKSKDSKSLRLHLQRHSQDKLQCTICFRFIDSAIKLIKHMDVHGEKKYFCLYCNKGFVRKKDCTKHERVRHTKTTPLKYSHEINNSPVSEEINV